jgi:hypothetical protein
VAIWAGPPDFRLNDTQVQRNFTSETYAAEWISSLRNGILKNCVFGMYRAPATKKSLFFQQLPRTLQPSEFVVLVTDSQIWMVKEHRNPGRFVTVPKRRNSFFSGAIGSEAWNAWNKTGARMCSVLPGPADE